jgi:hypothetical protein
VSPVRHWYVTAARVRAGGLPKQFTTWRYTMAKRGRKKRDRKHSKANHGKRPNS